MRKCTGLVGLAGLTLVLVSATVVNDALAGAPSGYCGARNLSQVPALEACAARHEAAGCTLTSYGKRSEGGVEFISTMRYSCPNKKEDPPEDLPEDPPIENPPENSGGGSGGGGGGGSAVYVPEFPYEVDLHTARSPATEEGSTPPNQMGEYKLKIDLVPIYTISEALSADKLVMSGVDACGNETLSFCRYLQDSAEKGTVTLYWSDLLEPFRRQRLAAALGLRFDILDATRRDPPGLCIIDFERDETDYDPEGYSLGVENLVEADAWRLRTLESRGIDAIPQNEESALTVGFSLDPGDTYNTCEM